MLKDTPESSNTRGSLRGTLDWLINPQSTLGSGRGMQAALGLFADMGCQVVVTVSTFLLTPFILAMTSKSLYGSWQAALSVLSYLAMLDAGLGFSLVRMVAGATGKRDPGDLSSVSSAALFSFSVIGAIVFALGFVAAPHIPVLFHVPPAEASKVVQAYRLAAIAGAIGLPLGTFNGILVGLQRTALAGLFRAGAALFGAVVTATLLACHVGIAALAWANLATSLSGGVLAFLVIPKLAPGFRLRLALVNRRELKRLWAVAGYFQLVRIASIVALNTDPLIIACFAGASQVTAYVITFRMATMFSVVLADKAPSAVYPAFAQMHARGELAALRGGYLALVFYCTRLAMVGAILVALLNQAFVGCWVGPQAYGGFELNSVLVCLVLFDTILRGSSLIPLVTGDMRAWSLASAVEAVVNVALSILFIKPFGLMGVALGTLLARLCITGAVVPIWSCRKLGLKFNSLIAAGILRPMLKSLPCAAAAWLAAAVLPLSLGWLRLGVVTVVAILANLAVFEGPSWLRKPTWSIRMLLGQVLKPQLTVAGAGSAE